jgi:hypothetical protein
LTENYVPFFTTIDDFFYFSSKVGLKDRHRYLYKDKNDTGGSLQTKGPPVLWNGQSGSLNIPDRRARRWITGVINPGSVLHPESLVGVDQSLAVQAGRGSDLVRIFSFRLRILFQIGRKHD